jgi:F-type H+-transporting ATPase subunit b
MKALQPGHEWSPVFPRPCTCTLDICFLQQQLYGLRIYYSRSMASTNPPPPAERASEIIDKLPSSPNLITKTGTAILGTGVVATAISQELYVVNEESIILLASIIFFTYIAKVRLARKVPTIETPSVDVFCFQIIREPYREWADGHIARIKNVLEGARAEHTQAVKDRIDSVGQMKDVVSLTEALFALSKVTSFFILHVC